MLKIFLAAFGIYQIVGVVILVIIGVLARRWRKINWPKLFIASISASLIATIAFYCFVEFADQGNTGGVSGIGVIVLFVFGLAIGGIVGLIALLIMAGMLSKKVMTEPTSLSGLSSSAISANSLTFLLACTMAPALFILFTMFFDAEGYFVVAFCGIVLGIAGLRESLFLDAKLDNFVITKRFLWAGLISAILALVGVVARYVMSGSIMHSKSFISFAIAAIVIFIPIGIFAWRIRKAGLASKNIT